MESDDRGRAMRMGGDCALSSMRRKDPCPERSEVDRTDQVHCTDTQTQHTHTHRM